MAPRPTTRPGSTGGSGLAPTSGAPGYGCQPPSTPLTGLPLSQWTPSDHAAFLSSFDLGSSLGCELGMDGQESVDTGEIPNGGVGVPGRVDNAQEVGIREDAPANRP